MEQPQDGGHVTRHLADAGLPYSPLNAVNGERHARAVLIYGAGVGKEDALPLLEDPNWEVWALNLVAPIDRHGRIRADRWFDLHQREAQSEDDLRWIAQCPVPIYVPPDLMDVNPRARNFPLAQIESEFGTNYWACTFAYQIALAMFEQIETIGLFGVELCYGTGRERTVEWANVMYWVGRAQERGHIIQVPQESTLGRHPARYGLEYQAEIDAVNRYTDMYDRLDIHRIDTRMNIGG